MSAAPRTLIVVQARFGSTRLPGKVLERLGARTVLAEVLARCARIPSATAVCCAVADAPADDPVAAEAARAGATVVRGPTADVLERYRLAAAAFDAEEVLRVTSDCPLIDPQLCGEVLALRRAESADYAANNMPPGFPHGLDCEAMTRDALEQAARHATASEDREHVTPWLRREPGIRRAALKGPGGVRVEHRWTLDYPADLEFFRALFAILPADGSGDDWRNICRILESRPEIAQINAAHRDTKRIGRTNG